MFVLKFAVAATRVKYSAICISHKPLRQVLTQAPVINPLTAVTSWNWYPLSMSRLGSLSSKMCNAVGCDFVNSSLQNTNDEHFRTSQKVSACHLIKVINAFQVRFHVTRNLLASGETHSYDSWHCRQREAYGEYSKMANTIHCTCDDERRTHILCGVCVIASTAEICWNGEGWQLAGVISVNHWKNSAKNY